MDANSFEAKALAIVTRNAKIRRKYVNEGLLDKSGTLQPRCAEGDHWAYSETSNHVHGPVTNQLDAIWPLPKRCRLCMDAIKAGEIVTSVPGSRLSEYYAHERAMREADKQQDQAAVKASVKAMNAILQAALEALPAH